MIRPSYSAQFQINYGELLLKLILKSELRIRVRCATNTVNYSAELPLAQGIKFSSD